MKRFTDHKGYSLIELVIYLAIVTVVSVGIVYSLITVMRTYATSRAYRRLENNGEAVLERIVRETRQSNSIGSGSVYGANPGTLALSSKDSGGAVHTLSFGIANGAVQLTDNGTTTVLTTPEVTVNTLVFRSISTPVYQGVKVELRLTTANGPSQSANFYATIMLRGNR